MRMIHEPNADAIRQKMAPGVAVHAERGTGKSTAIMSAVHDGHAVTSIIVCHDRRSADRMKNRYADAFPIGSVPIVVGMDKALDSVRGNGFPVYVDEWWLLPAQVRKGLRECGHEVYAVGTVMHLQQIPL